MEKPTFIHLNGLLHVRLPSGGVGGGSTGYFDRPATADEKRIYEASLPSAEEPGANYVDQDQQSEDPSIDNDAEESFHEESQG